MPPKNRRVAAIVYDGLCTFEFAIAVAVFGLPRPERYVDTLRSRYPRITVDPDVLYVDEGNILTSAGSAAGIDLCLYLVRRDYGAEIANAVARRMIVPPHRDGGQAQYVRTPVREVPD